MKTAYPELPLIENPKITTVGLEESVHILLSQTDECLARAVFAIMYAEARRTSDKKSFSSAGNYNYAGIQTDGNRWGYSDPIVNRFWKTDVGGNYREFAGFKNNEGFFDFMINRIKDKGFNGCDANQWTNTYIQKWWSPKKKAEYTIGTQKYNDKLKIFNSAMTRFDEYKKTFKGKVSTNQQSGGSSSWTTGILLGILFASSWIVYRKYKNMSI
jgi:hypothetical protein